MSYDDVLIGNAFLKIETDQKDISQVKVYYTMKWTAGDGETRLIIENENPIEVFKENEEDSEKNTVVLNLEDGVALVDVKLYGEITPEKRDGDYTVIYSITFHIDSVLS